LIPITSLPSQYGSASLPGPGKRDRGQLGGPDKADLYQQKPTPEACWRHQAAVVHQAASRHALGARGSGVASDWRGLQSGQIIISSTLAYHHLRHLLARHMTQGTYLLEYLLLCPSAGAAAQTEYLYQLTRSN
jgi:hypothetical protein